MEVTVTGQHVDVPDRVAERARRKFEHLARYLPLLEGAVVEVAVSREGTKAPDARFSVHVTVSGNGVHLRAEEHAAQPEAAIDSAAHVLTEQARRHKERLYKRSRTPRSGLQEQPVPEAGDEISDETPDPLNKITKVKRVAMKPMSVEEAVEEIELIGHEFFLFHDADTQQYAVIYRRSAGGYGLITPESP